MTMKKNIFLSIAAFYLLGSPAAYAQLNVELNVGQPAYVAPVPYVVPPAVYVSPYPTYYDPHHRWHDFRYWQERRAQNWHDNH